MTRKKTLTLAAAGASALLLLASTAAMAGPPTYLTVNGVGAPSSLVDVGGTSAGILNLDSDYDVPINCAPTTLGGQVYRGSLVDSTMPIGRISGLTGPCTLGAGNFPVAISKAGPDWSIVVKNAPSAAGSPIDVDIFGMSVQIDGGILCRFTATAAPGVPVSATLVPGPTGTYDARIDINSATSFPLVVAGFSGSMCGGQMFVGDRLRAQGSYNLKTTGAITGPISHS